MSAEVCKWCGCYSMDHDYEHLARTCYPERVKQLEQGLRAFLMLSWGPDAAPEPSCYLVEPVHEARKAMVAAGMLLDGKSPFSADTNGSVFVIEYADGNKRRAVWLDGRAYGEESRNLVPSQHLATFDAALSGDR